LPFEYPPIAIRVPSIWSMNGHIQGLNKKASLKMVSLRYAEQRKIFNAQSNP
jgi:hypothetical protein